MLAIDCGSWAKCIHILQFSMPPNIATFLHVNVVSGAAKHDHPPDRRAITESAIDILLQRHNPASPVCAVGSDERDSAAADDRIDNALEPKSTETHQTDGANARAPQH